MADPVALVFVVVGAFLWGDGEDGHHWGADSVSDVNLAMRREDGRGGERESLLSE